MQEEASQHMQHADTAELSKIKLLLISDLCSTNVIHQVRSEVPHHP